MWSIVANLVTQAIGGLQTPAVAERVMLLGFAPYVEFTSFRRRRLLFGDDGCICGDIWTSSAV
jgi:hypothetical protein